MLFPTNLLASTEEGTQRTRVADRLCPVSSLLLPAMEMWNEIFNQKITPFREILKTFKIGFLNVYFPSLPINNAIIKQLRNR